MPSLSKDDKLGRFISESAKLSALELSHHRLDIQSFALSPLSLLYYLGWQTYELAYALGIKSPQKPHSPIICVGNLTVGGMGKSPLTIALASDLVRAGFQVVIGASGYGSPRSQGASLAPDGPLNPLEWGDEPAMIRWLLPEIPIIVGRARVKAAELCAKQFPDAVLLMDDGFQHKPLKKDISILIDPPKVANPLCLPAGPYREPKSHRSRADFLLPDDIELDFSGYGLVDANLSPAPLDAGSKVQIITAIANPFRLMVTAETLGLTVVHGRNYPDHHPLQEPGLLKEFDPKIPIITTAKDWVKLRERTDIGQFNVRIVHLPAKINPPRFVEDTLAPRLHEIKKAKGA